MSSTTEAIKLKRIDALRKKLKAQNIDAAIVSKRENYIYMSGFTGTSAVLIITQSKSILVTDFRYVEQAGFEAGSYEIIKYEGSLNKAISSLLKSLNTEKLGFEEDYVSYSTYQEYKTLFPVKELVPLNKAIEELRIVKDESELQKIKKAVEIADNAFNNVLKFIKPGITEAEIAAELEYSMKKQGARGPSFDTIVASGKRAAMPHGVASMKKIELGDVITMDFGAIYNEYCSDMTRTVFLGKPSAELKKIYEIVKEAQQKSLEGAFKGLTGIQIDRIARDIISKNGFGNNFGHGLGHGVGIEIHEEPRFSPSGGMTLENGMVVTVEPGIYVENLGGVRIEDIIVISDNKPVVLTASAKDMIVL
jgi:Xaa-Pro aminopeptidase